MEPRLSGSGPSWPTMIKSSWMLRKCAISSRLFMGSFIFLDFLFRRALQGFEQSADLGTMFQGGVKQKDDLRGVPNPQPLGKLRSEEHTSELQSRENLVCRL